MGEASLLHHVLPHRLIVSLASSAVPSAKLTIKACTTAASWVLTPLKWVRSSRAAPASARGGQGSPRAARNLLGRVVLGLLAGEALQGLVTAGAVGCFWLFYWLYVPARTHTFPIYLEYPHLRPLLPEPASPDADGASPWPSLPPGSGRSAGGEVLDAEAVGTGRMASGAGRAQGTAEEAAALSACANVSLAGNWGRFTRMDVDLALTLPPLPDSWALWPAMCSLWLLDARGMEVAVSRRPVLLPHKHWVVRLWSAVLWGPLIALGLASGDRDAVAVPLLEAAALAAPAAGARLCLTPALPAYAAELRLHLRLRGPLRLVQAWPKLCSLAIAAGAAVASWAATGGLVLGFLLRTPSGLATRTEVTKPPHSEEPLRQRTGVPEASAAAVQAKAFTTHLMADVLEGDDEPSLDAVSDSSEATPVGRLSPDKRPITGAISELAAAAREAATDRKLQAAAGSAAGGAVVLGTGGAATGMLAGGAVGAACGVVPAFFTFGLSIPVGAVIGSSAGAVLLSAVGGSLGFLGGGALGYGISSQLEADSARGETWRTVGRAAGPEGQKAAAAQARVACPPMPAAGDAGSCDTGPRTSPMPSSAPAASGSDVLSTPHRPLVARVPRSSPGTGGLGALH